MPLCLCQSSIPFTECETPISSNESASPLRSEGRDAIKPTKQILEPCQKSPFKRWMSGKLTFLDMTQTVKTELEPLSDTGSGRMSELEAECCCCREKGSWMRGSSSSDG